MRYKFQRHRRKLLKCSTNAVASASGAKVIFLTSGTTWTVPADWNNAANTIECIGGGASGAGNTSLSQAGGGGGAYAAISNLLLTPGNIINLQVGAGGAYVGPYYPAAGTDTWFNGTSGAASSVWAQELRAVLAAPLLRGTLSGR